MSGLEVGPDARVEDGGALEVEACEVLHGELARDGEFAQKGRAVAILSLHAREVGRGRRLPAQDEVGKDGFAARGLDGGVESSFVAHGGLRNSAQGLAAGSCRRCVAGPDLEVLGEFDELADRIEKLVGPHFLRPLLARSGLKQVRATEITDEDEVAGSDAHWLLGSRAKIGHQKRDVFWRVAGRVQGLELDVADLEGVVVPEQLVGVGAAAGLLVEPTILPVGPALGGKVRLDALCCQFAAAGEEVGVDVCFGSGEPRRRPSCFATAM